MTTSHLPARRCRRGLRAVAGVCAFVLGLAGTAAAQTPAGTVISASASASYQNAGGATEWTSSNIVVIVVGQVAAADLEAPASVTASPGTTVVLPHVLTNPGNGPDRFTLSAVSQLGRTVVVWHDVDGNGQIGGADSLVSAPLPLVMGGSANLLMAVTIPASRNERGTVDVVTLTATSEFDSSANDSVIDTITVPATGIAVVLSKQVDHATATVGDALAYTIGYQAVGTGSATGIEITDLLPAGVVYTAGTLRWNGTALTDAADTDAGEFDATQGRLRVRIGDLAAPDAGSIVFGAQMTNIAVVDNVVGATYGTPVGADTVFSTAARTTLALPDVWVRKDLIGANQVHDGDTVTYRIAAGNGASAPATAHDVVVSDTLPGGLTHLRSRPSAQIAGNVARWSVGDLAPGAQTMVEIDAVVTHSGADTVRLTNIAAATGANASVVMATAAALTVANATGASLSVQKAAGTLEAGLGEAAPFTITVINTGPVALSDVRIYDQLPAELRLIAGGTLGADSVVQRGTAHVFYIAGPIAPGGRQAVRYAASVVSGSREMVLNRAYATAFADLVRSEEAVAGVRVRRGSPMATRLAIGKVWLDVNDNGVQDAGEAGVEGVDIWGSDGEIVTSDRDGRFSFRTLRTGRQAFRLDASTIPSDLRLTSAPDADLEVLDADGWTTPRIAFPLVPRGAAIVAVRAPLPWQFLARPIRRPKPDTTVIDPIACPAAPVIPSLQAVARYETGGKLDPIVLRGITFETAKAVLLDESRMVLDDVAAALIAHPYAAVEVAGHTDAAGDRQYNRSLSMERAATVIKYLEERGVSSDRLHAIGYGPDRPIASNRSSAGMAQNRRVEFRVLEDYTSDQGTSLRAELAEVSRAASAPAAVCTASRVVSDTTTPLIQYEVRVENLYDAPITGLSVAFDPRADSAAFTFADSVGPTTALDLRIGGLVTLPRRELFGTFELPALPPHSRGLLLAWRGSRVDSVSVMLRGAGIGEGLRAEIHNPLRPVSGAALITLSSAVLPRPSALPAGSVTEVVLTPRRRGDLDMTWPVPDGWMLHTDSATDGRMTAIRDRSGREVLLWRLAESTEDVTVRLQPAGGVKVDTVSITPLRQVAERNAEKRRAFVAGPAVEIFAPVDGVVLASDRLWIGVRGERGRRVSLFDGDSLIAEELFRGDGIYDFIGVQLARGPHRLRVRSLNSWNQTRWDSAAVHVSGAPARFVTDSAVEMVADGHSTTSLRVRLLDTWGVPVVGRPMVTLEAAGAVVKNADADPSSVGVHVRPDAAGWLTVDLTAGRDVVPGRVTLSSGAVSHTVPLELVPAIRPLMITGIGRVGVGASPDAFGSISVRGRLASRTSLTLRYDSRRADELMFANALDPLEAAQYPIVGDSGLGRTPLATQGSLSARLERGHDWLAAGDIVSSGFDRENALTDYRRALSGGAGRVGAGPLVVHGFASSTRQSLRNAQLRGAGISGPYVLGAEVRPGTERIVIETRALDNPQRVLARQALTRFVDYQLDPMSGVLLMTRPIPASDAYGNPVFIVATYEANGGGDASGVWGLRTVADLGRLTGVGRIGRDSTHAGVTWIHDGARAGGYDLTGFDLRMRTGILDVMGEVARSMSQDSTGSAATISGTVHAARALDLTARWTITGDGFTNPAMASLRPASSDVALGGSWRHPVFGELKLSHERQHFGPEEVTRGRTMLGAVRPLTRKLTIESSVMTDNAETPTGNSGSQAGELKLGWQASSRTSVWAEGRHQFAADGLLSRPDHLGLGVRTRLWQGLSLEATHRHVIRPGAEGDYAVSSLGVRTQLVAGTEAWGSLQRSDLEAAPSAALLGLSSRVRFGTGWSAFGSFERRSGVGRADPTDPVRALPFLQVEEDYWATGAGMELIPAGKTYRASARGEIRNGTERSTRLLVFSGDLALHRGLAVLSRQEFVQATQVRATDALLSRRLWSVWGLAMRPTTSDRLNALVKLEWLDAVNPAGSGVLTSQGHEGRLIGAAEAIWAPAARLEFGARIARRHTRAQLMHEDSTVQSLTSRASFIGARAGVEVAPRFALRAEGRLLVDHQSATSRYDLAPQLAFTPIPGLEFAAGYRFGNLKDPDFAVSGGEGAFVTLGVRVTERSAASAAAFWRERMTGR